MGAGKPDSEEKPQLSMKFSNVDEARQALFEYIEGWNNTQRLPSSLDYMSPVENEQSWLPS